jgi:hypothetical protein
MTTPTTTEAPTLNPTMTPPQYLKNYKPIPTTQPIPKTTTTKNAYTSTKDKNTEKSNKKAHDDEQKAQRTKTPLPPPTIPMSNPTTTMKWTQMTKTLILTYSPANILTTHLPKPTHTTKPRFHLLITTKPPIQDNTSEDELEISTKPDDDSTDFTPVHNTRKKNTTTPRQVGMATPDDNMDVEADPDAPPPTPGDPIPIDNDRDCRYSVILSIPPSTEPWKVFTDLLKNFLKSIQEQTTKKLHIALWDPELAEDTPLIKKPSEFPEDSAKN